MAVRKKTSERKWYPGNRRGKRMNSRVPVALEWCGDAGQAFRFEAHTRIVNAYGCLVILPQNLPLDMRLDLTNLATQQKNDAVVVWKGAQRTDGWEIGIELVGPEMDFWGIEL